MDHQESERLAQSFSQRLSSFFPPETNMVVEYAESDSSSCKKCDKKISAKALRFGVARNDFRLSLCRIGDLRGYDDMNWYHLDCYFAAFGSLSSRSESKIDGFYSLESNDQEEFLRLKRKFAVTWLFFSEKEQEKLRAVAVDNRKKLTINKVRKTDDKTSEEKQRSLKKTKLSAPSEEVELPIAISVSDIKYKYKDGKRLPINWRAFETVIFLEMDEGLHDSRKIAAFDFDGCLVNTDVKRVRSDAWSPMYPSVLDKLHSLYIDGYKLVIFTNESNIEGWKNKGEEAVDSKIRRLHDFIMKVYIACGVGERSDGKPEDRFRKPKTGMWRIMEQNFNSGLAIDMDQSFYVGNAAGRLNDHSDADIKFAQAIGLKFHVPKDYFGT